MNLVIYKAKKTWRGILEKNEKHARILYRILPEPKKLFKGVLNETQKIKVS
jgi:hypothetical protein